MYALRQYVSTFRTRLDVRIYLSVEASHATRIKGEISKTTMHNKTSAIKHMVGSGTQVNPKVP